MSSPPPTRRHHKPDSLRETLRRVAAEDFDEAAVQRTGLRRVTLLLGHLGLDRWSAWLAASELTDHPERFTVEQLVALAEVAAAGAEHPKVARPA